MFRLSFSPQFLDAELTIEKQGDTLIINGIELDFSDMVNGGEYPRGAIEHPFVLGGVTKDFGVVYFTILLPYTNPNPPISVTDPEPTMVVLDGIFDLPADRHPPEKDDTDGDQ